MSNSSKSFRRACGLILDQLFNSRVYGSSPEVSGDNLESDGRKRPKLIRQLQEQGLIGEKGRWGYKVTDEILGFFDAEIPDLVAKVKEDEYTMARFERGDFHNEVLTHGFPVNKLTRNEKACILWHYNEYGVGHYGYGKFEEFEFGTNPEGDKWQRTLLVFTPAYDEFIEELQFKARAQRTVYNNVGWGLKTLCGCTEADVEFVGSCEERQGRIGFGGPRTKPLFVKGEDWEKEMGSSVDATRKQLAELTRQMDALHNIEKRVALYGGWEKFRNDLEALVIKELRKEDEEEANAEA
jgi:hypothetical protein